MKLEDISLKGYASLLELMVGSLEYVAFYHGGVGTRQSLGNRTLGDDYALAHDGGPRTMDKCVELGQRYTAAWDRQCRPKLGLIRSCLRGDNREKY